MSERPNPQLNKAWAALALSSAGRTVHRWVLTVFAETGHAPSRADLDRVARDYGVDPGSVLAELTGRDVLALDERGGIRAAYPFSPVPTRHRVTWVGGAGVHAMCAVDALGISAMLGVPITITSSEPGTDRTVTVQVDHDNARWEHATAVVFSGHTRTNNAACCPSVDRTCGHINFFTTPKAAQNWTGEHPDVTGVVLDQDQALASGVTEFGALLQPVVQETGP
jgi:hypothetical protein